MLRRALLFTLALVLSQSLAAQPPAAAPETTQPVAELSARDAIVLGLVEGVTEFLPVSSTGHLIIANNALGLTATEPLRDPEGRPLYYKKPSAENPAGVPLTLKLAADTYAVVIQVGAIGAVALIYFQAILAMLRGAIGQNPRGVRLLRNVLLAFFPVAILGLAANKWIDEHLFSLNAVIGALIAGAILMFAVEVWRKRSALAESKLEPADLTAKQALGIGLLQCCALWPGTSRSMVTMVGGYFAGLAPARAAEFSFLVGLPTLAGAAVYKGYKAGPAMIQVFGWSHVLLGALVAAIAAAIAVKFLVSYLSRHGLGLFAIYRLIVAAVLIAGVANGWFTA